MKKLLAFITGAFAVLAITACGSATSSTAGSSAAAASQAVNHEGKTLVVYYSAQGHTKQVASYIAKATNGDLLELTPETPYTEDDLNYRDSNSRVVKEHDNPSLRDVALTNAKVDNLNDYSTVFVGYPIWWGIAAWPVNDFVKSNDFSGKTVIPFCTSASSGLGDSGKNLAQLAGTGHWLEGERFSSYADESEVTDWVKSLGY